MVSIPNDTAVSLSLSLSVFTILYVSSKTVTVQTKRLKNEKGRNMGACFRYGVHFRLKKNEQKRHAFPYPTGIIYSGSNNKKAAHLVTIAIITMIGQKTKTKTKTVLYFFFLTQFDFKIHPPSIDMMGVLKATNEQQMSNK